MKGYLFSNQISLIGRRTIIGYGTPTFFVMEIPRKKSNEIIIKNHYSKKVAGFGCTSYIFLGVFIDGRLVGTLQFGYAMNQKSCENIVKNTSVNEYLELNRMWFDDIAPKNSESKALSYSIKYIRGKFPRIQWIQSFADERCGCFGIVYQSANFKYYGEHLNEFYDLDGETIHKMRLTRKEDSRYNELNERKNEMKKNVYRQFRYIYFIYQNKIKDCLFTEQPYPKHYKETANPTA